MTQTLTSDTILRPALFLSSFWGFCFCLSAGNASKLPVIPSTVCLFSHRCLSPRGVQVYLCFQSLSCSSTEREREREREREWASLCVPLCVFYYCRLQRRSLTTHPRSDYVCRDLGSVKRTGTDLIAIRLFCSWLSGVQTSHAVVPPPSCNYVFFFFFSLQSITINKWLCAPCLQYACIDLDSNFVPLCRRRHLESCLESSQTTCSQFASH